MSLIVTLSHALFKGVQLQWPAIMSHDYTHYGLSATRRTGLNDRSNIPNQTLSKKVSPLDFEHIHWAIHLRLKPIWVLIKMKDRFFLFFILGMYMFEIMQTHFFGHWANLEVIFKNCHHFTHKSVQKCNFGFYSITGNYTNEIRLKVCQKSNISEENTVAKFGFYCKNGNFSPILRLHPITEGIWIKSLCFRTLPKKMLKTDGMTQWWNLPYINIFLENTPNNVENIS